jgi:hypothetical protein
LHKNVVRIQTEMFKPGEVVRGEVIDLYIKPPSNCVWYPKMPNVTLVDDAEGAHTIGHRRKMLRFDSGGIFFRFDALGPEADGLHMGDIDLLLETIPAGVLFRQDIPHLATLAQLDVRIFNDKPYWAAIAIYSVDVEQKLVEFEATLELDEIYDKTQVEQQ